MGQGELSHRTGRTHIYMITNPLFYAGLSQARKLGDECANRCPSWVVFGKTLAGSQARRFKRELAFPRDQERPETSAGWEVDLRWGQSGVLGGNQPKRRPVLTFIPARHRRQKPVSHNARDRHWDAFRFGSL